MRWRHLLFDNLWWKLLAFCLAVMIWSGAQNVEVRPLPSPLLPPTARTFHDVPIRVLAPPGIEGPLRLEPPTAQIEVTGEATLIRRLGASDPLVYVEIADDLAGASITNRIDVRLPAGATLVQIVPEVVVISRRLED